MVWIMWTAFYFKNLWTNVHASAMACELIYRVWWDRNYKYKDWISWILKQCNHIHLNQSLKPPALRDHPFRHHKHIYHCLSLLLRDHILRSLEWSPKTSLTVLFSVRCGTYLSNVYHCFCQLWKPIVLVTSIHFYQNKSPPLLKPDLKELMKTEY